MGWGKTISFLIIVLYIVMNRDMCADGYAMRNLISHRRTNNHFSEHYNVTYQECIANCMFRRPRCIGASFSRIRMHCLLSGKRRTGGYRLVLDKYYIFVPVKSRDLSFLADYFPVTCDQGWQFYKGRCYKFDLQWHGELSSAQRYCKSYAARVLEIRTKEKNDFVTDMIFMMLKAAATEIFVWLGGTDDGHEGQFVWLSDQTNFHNTYTHWEHLPFPQPDNFDYGSGLSENCLAAHFRYPNKNTWRDILCFDKHLRVICEKELH